MPQATFTFPTGFLWGTATASHQVEGNNTNNNWYYWENQPGRILNGDKAGLACDWWGGRWRDDFDRAAENSQNAIRMSVEWSRIQPAPDRWNEDALDVYRQMMRGLHVRGITPMVTLHHFSEPLWLMERGGWQNDETPALFETFTRKVVDALREYCTTWIPINEPNVFTYFAFLEGAFPPGKRDQSAAFKVMANMVRGHALAYRAIKSIQREARVGTAVHMRGMYPAHDWLLLDSVLARQLSQNFNYSFLNALADGRLRFLLRSTRIPAAVGTQDFIGINYYSGDQVAFNLLRPGDFFTSRYFPKDVEVSETGLIANRPTGLYEFLKQVKNYRLPIFITENGIEDPADRLRPRYLVEHLNQLWRAVSNNWQIKGYFHWTLVDNFEWERGWTQRFGLYGLDVDTQTRIRRPSVDLYGEICKANALSSEMVAKYAPDAFPILFPE